jgi:hypothetical protein
MRIGSGICAVALLSAWAARAEELTFDQVAPLSSDGRAAVDGDAGPVHFAEIVVNGVPSEDKIRKDTHEWDHAKPRPIVTLSNPSSNDAKVRLDLTLEDDQGNVYMRCSRSAEVDGHTKKDTYSVCVSDVMKTMDWPKVTRVHLVARVEVDEEDEDD